MALADVIYNYYGWRYVSVFAASNSYSNELAYVFLSAAKKLNLNVLSVSVFQSGSMDLTAATNTALDTGSRIFVLLMGAEDANRLLVQGHSLGLFQEGTQIFGCGRMTDPATWAGMTPDTLSVMKGYLGLLPFNDQDSPAAKGFVDRFRRMNDTAIVHSDGSITCDPSLDSNNIPLWRNSSNGCMGLRFSEYDESGSDISFYAPYAYDATYAIAYALHAYLSLVSQLTSLLSTLRNVVRTSTLEVKLLILSIPIDSSPLTVGLTVLRSVLCESFE
jgi:ABC-type branched-subunit amino acid transport system substrate-binding protein